MSECCRKGILFLSYMFASVGSIGYSFYLIWLLADLKDNANFWFFAFIPGMFLAMAFLVFVFIKDDDRAYVFILYCVYGLMLMVMCSFTMLTRQAYYHLSTDGLERVIVSLKATIVFFISGFLVEKECRLQRILESKDILSRGVLDFVDIFDLAELLSLNECVGIGSSVTEGSSLEMAIQAFCTISVSVIYYINDPMPLLRKYKETGHYTLMPKFMTKFPVIYFVSLIQNIPFLVIRIIVWAQHGMFSLGFMVKNIWAIVVCCAEICTKNDQERLLDGAENRASTSMTTIDEARPTSDPHAA